MTQRATEKDKDADLLQKGWRRSEMVERVIRDAPSLAALHPKEIALATLILAARLSLWAGVPSEQIKATISLIKGYYLFCADSARESILAGAETGDAVELLEGIGRLSAVPPIVLIEFMGDEATEALRKADARVDALIAKAAAEATKDTKANDA